MGHKFLPLLGTLLAVLLEHFILPYRYGKIFHEHVNVFSRGEVKIKPKSEISCHITVTSVIISLFMFTVVVCTM